MVTYAFAYGPVIYEGPGKDGAPLTLVRAMREVHGVGDASVLRLLPDGTYRTVVTNAGSAYGPMHVASGRTLRRRQARHLDDADRRATLDALHAKGRHVLTAARECPSCRVAAPVLAACSA